MADLHQNNMSRIAGTFEKLKSADKKALIPFVTAGDPNPQMTMPIMRALVEAGADIIELGVPFSDPMADGPTIQRSSERALVHGGRRICCLPAHIDGLTVPHSGHVSMQGNGKGLIGIGQGAFNIEISNGMAHLDTVDVQRHLLPGACISTLQRTAEPHVIIPRTRRDRHAVRLGPGIHDRQCVIQRGTDLSGVRRIDLVYR